MVLESAKILLENGKISNFIKNSIIEYSLGLGANLDEINEKLQKYGISAELGQNYYVFEYAKNRILNKSSPGNFPNINKDGYKSPVFLFDELVLIDQNMISLKFSDALNILTNANIKLSIIDACLNIEHVEIKEILAILEDTILIKLNRTKEFLIKYQQHIKQFPLTREFYALYFECASQGEIEINSDLFISEVSQKFPNWSWVLNIKAWLLYSKNENLSEIELVKIVKLLEESLKIDKSMSNNARIKLATILWNHQGILYGKSLTKIEILKQPMEAIFQLWLEFAKGNPSNSSIFYCIALYLLFIVFFEPRLIL